MKKITVSDFTLKTAEIQSLSLTFREKLAIAEKLDAARVDAIELPSLSDSKENEVICRTIATSIKNAIVKISVSDEAAIISAAECVKKAAQSCLQVVLPVSTVQMEYFHHVKAPVMQAKIGELISSAKKYANEVEFVARDAFRAEEGFLEACAKTAYDCGATSIVVCDDVGDAFPEDFAAVVKKIKSVCDIKVIVRCSNAMSMAMACAVEAIKAGADGVSTSVYGEYLSVATFADLIRAKKFNLDVDCGVDVTNVKTICGSINQANESVADASEGKNGQGYIDANATAKEVFAAIKQLGYELSDADVGKVYEEFKKLAAKKATIDNKELEAVIASTAMQVPSTYHLVNYVVNSSNIIAATANVTLEKDGEKFTGVSTGDGPIDAAFHAIEQIIGHHYELDDFQVHAVTKGRGAVGSSIIRLRADGKLYPGNGVSTDIVGACIRAYINALNKIVYEGN